MKNLQKITKNKKIKEIKIFINAQKTGKILLTILALVAIFSVIWLAFYNQNFYYLLLIFLILFYYFWVIRRNKNKQNEVKTLFFHENSEIFFEKNRIKILANETFVHRFLLCFTALDQGNQQKHRFVLFADNFVKADDFRWLKMQLRLKY